MTRVVISLTSIPPRFGSLHACLSALLQQTAEIAAVNLYLPRQYRRFPGTWPLPIVPEGVSIHQVAHDLGPATKILPAVAAYRGTDTLILFCDDDRIYDPGWAAHLIAAAKAHPGSAVAAFGTKVSHISDTGWVSPQVPAAPFVKKDLAYRAKRALSLGRWKPSAVSGSGYVDILCGWGGASVRPEFFQASDFEIPDVLWTVDDVWLSGCLAKNGLSIWLEKMAPAQRPKVGGLADQVHALRDWRYRGFDRAQANAACVRYFRETYGIWGGQGACAPLPAIV